MKRRVSDFRCQVVQILTVVLLWKRCNIRGKYDFFTVICNQEIIKLFLY